MSNNLEQTLSIIKPDAVERNLVEEIKNIFVKNNFKIKDSKKFTLLKMRLQNFIKCTNLNRSTMTCVLIFHQVQ